MQIDVYFSVLKYNCRLAIRRQFHKLTDLNEIMHSKISDPFISSTSQFFLHFKSSSTSSPFMHVASIFILIWALIEWSDWMYQINVKSKFAEIARLIVLDKADIMISMILWTLNTTMWLFFHPLVATTARKSFCWG